jgi:hypothetical protein
MKRRAALVLAMAVGLLLLTTGVSWAKAHGGVSATVAPDGTAVFTTTDGPATADIKVSVASYTGLWKGQTEPEMFFAVTRGVIAAGTSTVTLKVAIPSCGPFQMDTFLGWEVPAKIYYPEGSGVNGLKGQEYEDVLAPCTTPTPTPTTTPSVTPSVSPTTSPTNHPGSVSPTASTSTSVLGEKLASGESLAATGSSAAGPMTALGTALLALGLVAVATARRRRPARRH